ILTAVNLPDAGADRDSLVFETENGLGGVPGWPSHWTACPDRGGENAGHAVPPAPTRLRSRLFASPLSHDTPSERPLSACPRPPTWADAPILTAVKIARAGPTGEPVADGSRLQSGPSGPCQTGCSAADGSPCSMADRMPVTSLMRSTRTSAAVTGQRPSSRR